MIKNLWNYFDSIEVITTNKSDRLPDLLDNLKKSYFNLDNIRINKSDRKGTDNLKKCNMFKIPFVKDESCCDDACKSCNDSHIKIIKRCYEEGKENILIFEDDARFNLPIDIDKVMRVINWLQVSDNWEIFYFGSIPILSYPINSFIMRSYKPYLAHCYSLNRKGMKKILENNELYNYHYDVKISNMSNLKKYVIFPSINNQVVAPGDYNRSSVSKFIPFKGMTILIEYLFFLLIPILIIIYIMIKKTK
jgi:hypothetical protein